VVWIDKETFLVRKMEQVNDRGVKIVTTYNPVINVKIPDAALEYNIHP
jgi:outer membrane lipoprotein-sorting protein